MTAAFPDLLSLDDGRFAIDIAPALAVGPPGHASLIGGA